MHAICSFIHTELPPTAAAAAVAAVVVVEEAVTRPFLSSETRCLSRLALTFCFLSSLITARLFEAATGSHVSAVRTLDPSFFPAFSIPPDVAALVLVAPTPGEPGEGMNALASSESGAEGTEGKMEDMALEVDGMEEPEGAERVDEEGATAMA